MFIFESAIVNLLKALRSLGDHLPNISQKGKNAYSLTGWQVVAGD